MNSAQTTATIAYMNLPLLLIPIFASYYDQFDKSVSNARAPESVHSSYQMALLDRKSYFDSLPTEILDHILCLLPSASPESGLDRSFPHFECSRSLERPCKRYYDLALPLIVLNRRIGCHVASVLYREVEIRSWDGLTRTVSRLSRPPWRIEGGANVGTLVRSLRIALPEWIGSEGEPGRDSDDEFDPLRGLLEICPNLSTFQTNEPLSFLRLLSSFPQTTLSSNLRAVCLDFGWVGRTPFGQKAPASLALKAIFSIESLRTLEIRGLQEPIGDPTDTTTTFGLPVRRPVLHALHLVRSSLSPHFLDHLRTNADCTSLTSLRIKSCPCPGDDLLLEFVALSRETLTELVLDVPSPSAGGMSRTPAVSIRTGQGSGSRSCPTSPSGLPRRPPSPAGSSSSSADTSMMDVDDVDLPPLHFPNLSQLRSDVPPPLFVQLVGRSTEAFPSLSTLTLGANNSLPPSPSVIPILSSVKCLKVEDKAIRAGELDGTAEDRGWTNDQIRDVWSSCINHDVEVQGGVFQRLEGIVRWARTIEGF